MCLGVDFCLRAGERKLVASVSVSVSRCRLGVCGLSWVVVGFRLGIGRLGFGLSLGSVEVEGKLEGMWVSMGRCRGSWWEGVSRLGNVVLESRAVEERAGGVVMGGVFCWVVFWARFRLRIGAACGACWVCVADVGRRWRGWEVKGCER